MGPDETPMICRPLDEWHTPEMCAVCGTTPCRLASATLVEHSGMSFVRLELPEKYRPLSTWSGSGGG